MDPNLLKELLNQNREATTEKDKLLDPVYSGDCNTDLERPSTGFIAGNTSWKSRSSLSHHRNWRLKAPLDRIAG
uniref:Uncharacterized protein n=1 Tax=Ditylenchus dipsaci TaxID=166011 RepID=A0A915CVP9_9BILA